MLSPAAIDDLVARVDLRSVAEQLGARLNRRGLGACPICGGGKSAQRFEIKDNGRAWVCAVCQAGGDAIALVQRAKAFSFPQAVEWLGGARKIDPQEEARRFSERAAREAKREAEAARYREAERRRLFAMWRAAGSFLGSPVELYLRGRGVDGLDDLALRYAPDMPFFEGETRDELGRGSPRIIHRGPAMLAPFLDANGVFRGLHITWINPARPGEKAEIFHPETGEKLNPKKMRGSKAGMFIPLGRRGDPARLRAAEGIETTLSVRDLLRDGATYRAAGDLGNLGGGALASVPHSSQKLLNGHSLRFPGAEPNPEKPGMPVPGEADEIWWFADGDSDPELTDCAMRRAVARHARPGRAQRIVPAPERFDWNDVARGKADAAKETQHQGGVSC